MIKSNITISDIAEQAGVSKATVSRVLNTPDIVEKHTREKVIQIMKELHYSPSQAARNLSMKSSSTIGVIVPEISNTFFGELFSGVEDITNKNNLSLLYSSNDNDQESDYKALDMMKMQRVKGLLYIPAVNYAGLGILDKLQRKLHRLDCPVVCMDRDIGLQCDVVHFDDQSAVRKAVMALVDAGHRKIAIIIGEKESILSIQRFQGYLDGLEQANITFDEDFVYQGTYTRLSGYQVTKQMIAQKKQPTAVITCNNLLSKGYIQAVCEHTNGNMTLYTHIGLDEIDMMNFLGIPYNCIQRDAYELGRSAAELLMRRIERPDGVYQHMILSSPLVHQTF